MRLFVGIDLPDEVQGCLERLVGKLRPSARIKWSPVENLHVTTKFIGEWPEARLGEVSGALRGLPAHPPFEIGVGGLGWFPNPHHPRVFWAGVHGGDELAALARLTDDALAELGIAKETRPFSPHLTLARIKEPAPDLVRLRQAVASLDTMECGRFRVDRFYLYHSQMGSQGSVYTKLGQFPLVGP